MPLIPATRRQFLRGACAAIALPALESFAGKPLASNAAPSLATTPSGAPLRTAFISFPNGAIPNAWWPKETTGSLELSRTLAPLEPIKHKLQVLAGLDHQLADGSRDGAGDHARGNSVLLTGVRLNKSATELRAGQSIDQAIAERVGTQTRFPSLELTCDAVRKSGVCDSGYSCAYQFNVSWRDAQTPMTPESSPRAAFERLFGAGSHGQRQANLAQRRIEQRSLLDFVRADAHAFQKKLSRTDRVKLDQYLTGVREIERRIAGAEDFGATPDPAVATPRRRPAEYMEHVELMFELLTLAFQTDSTRVATFMMAHDGSNRPFPQLGLSEGHHDLTHHQNREDWIRKVELIDRWYVERFSRFLTQLDNIKEADGHSLLDNSMIVYASGNADANRHSHVNLPMLLAGGGGGQLHPGRFVAHGAKPATNLFLTLADLMGGAPLPRLGDSTGPLADV